MQDRGRRGHEHMFAAPGRGGKAPQAPPTGWRAPARRARPRRRRRPRAAPRGHPAPRASCAAGCAARACARPHLDEGVLGAVRPGEVLVALEVVAVPDLARVAHGEAGAAQLLLHLRVPGSQVGVDRLAHARLHDVGARRRSRSPPGARACVEKKRIVMPLEPASAEIRIAGVPVVDEDQLRAAEGERGLASLRVARDVELVRGVGHQLEAREERGVVDGGGDLGDPAADRVLEPAGRDLRRLDEPAVERARTQGVVEREGPARQG